MDVEAVQLDGDDRKDGGRGAGGDQEVLRATGR
jgi:hypothetical protein